MQHFQVSICVYHALGKKNNNDALHIIQKISRINTNFTFFFICAFYDNFIISAGIREGLCVFNNDLEFTGNVGILVRRAYEKP